MTTVALARVALVHPLGDMGDRNIQGVSTIITGDVWLAEADYRYGSIGDVTVYMNTNQYMKGAKPNWQWYAAIPTANIKAYKLAGEAEVTKPATYVDPTNDEPKAPPPTPRAPAAVTAGKS